MLRPACDSSPLRDNGGYFNDATNSRVQLMPSSCSCLPLRSAVPPFPPLPIQPGHEFHLARIPLRIPNGIGRDLSGQTRKHTVFSPWEFSTAFASREQFEIRNSLEEQRWYRNRAVRLVACLFLREVTQETAVSYIRSNLHAKIRIRFAYSFASITLQVCCRFLSLVLHSRITFPSADWSTLTISDFEFRFFFFFKFVGKIVFSRTISI